MNTMLQRSDTLWEKLEGLSDREAVDRLSFDLRWKYAAGGLEAVTGTTQRLARLTSTR